MIWAHSNATGGIGEMGLRGWGRRTFEESNRSNFEM